MTNVTLRGLRTVLTGLLFCSANAALALTLTVDTDRELTDAEKTLLNGDEKNTPFVKKGTGTLTVDGISGFKSTMTVEAGIVKVIGNTGLGSERSNVLAVDVLNDARLSLELATGKDARLFNRSIRIAGDGPDGKGALYNNGFYLTKLILADDASTYGLLRCIEQGQPGFTSTIDMGGHKLTLNGNANWGFSTLNNPGSIKLTGSSQIQLLGGCGLTGGESCEFELADSAWLSLYNWKVPFTWKLHITSSSTTIHAGDGTDAEKSNIFSGPVVIDDGVEAAIKNGGNANFTITFAGKISGAGTLKMASQGHLRLLGTANDYSGTITIAAINVTVHAPNAGSFARQSDGSINLPTFAYSSDKVVLGAQTTSHATGWNAAELDEIVAGYGANRVSLEITSGETFVYDRTVSGAFPACTGGTVSFTEGVTNYPALSVGNAEFTEPTDGQALELGNLTLTGGTASFSNTYLKWNSSGPILATAIGAASVARMVLQDQTVCAAGNGFSIAATANTCGIVEVRPDALVTNNMMVGTASGACGAVYQSGGKIVQTSDVVWGDKGGYGYHELSGGTLASGWIHSLGKRGGTGIFYQKGGYFCKDPYPLCLGYSGTSVVYQTAGYLDHGHERMQIGEMRWLGSDEQRSMDSFANYTVSGTATTEVWIVDAARHPNMDAYINLNDGGTLKSDSIIKNCTLQSGVTSPQITNNRLYVNFNGGTLRSRNTAKTGLISASSAPDRVTVYPKGAAIEVSTAGFNDLELAVPLQAPGEGNGVTSVTWTASAGYIAPPLVTIAGDGQCATAVAEFDSASGTVTGITITSPGWGYKTATATLSGGGKAGTVTASCVLGDVTGGGFAKRGSGKLTFTAVNTYTGPTAVEAGTLAQGVAGAIPSGAKLVLSQGATLDLGNFATTFSGVSGTGGKVTNGDLVLTGELKLSANKFLTRETTAIDGVIDLTGVTQLTLTDSEILTPETPKKPSVNLLSATMIRYPSTPLVITGVPSGWGGGLHADGHLPALRARSHDDFKVTHSGFSKQRAT